MSEVEPDLEAGVAATSTNKAAARLEVVVFVTVPPPPRPRQQPPPPWPPMKVADGTPWQQWDFVRKVYAAILLQYCLAGSAVAVTCFVPAVPRYFTSGPHAAAYFALVAIVVAPFVALWPMIKYREKHPVNLLLLGLVTLGFSLSIGILTNAFTAIGRAVLQFMVLIGAAMVNLIFYTIWAAMRQYQVTTYCPFLINHVLMFLFYMLTQAYCPLGSFNVTFFGCFFAMMFAMFIVYDIPVLIKRHSYNDTPFGWFQLMLVLVEISAGAGLCWFRLVCCERKTLLNKR